MKKIRFKPTRPLVSYSEPRPSSKVVPAWFRKFSGVVDGSETIKKCVPFLDSMTSGYMMVLAADVYVDAGGPQSVSKDPMVTKHIESQIGEMKVPYEYVRTPYKWMNYFIAKTQRGYSTMFVHPINRPDLPFYTLGGVVDTDKFPLAINFPFFLRKDFVGIIPAGTPIAQAIPFKREGWSMSIDNNKDYSEPTFAHTMHNPPFGYYKKNFWSRKKYS
jgi:hypothetical protein